MTGNIKIALLGHGKMGRLIESIAKENNLEVVACYDENSIITDDQETKEKLKDVSVLVDFSIPSAVKDNVQAASTLQKNIVIGTTGWAQDYKEISDLVQKSGIGLLYAANFSIGVNLFYKISEYAAQLFKELSQYDAYIHEAHHKMKKDAPSGTALTLKELVKKHYSDTEIPVSSTRAGYIPGTHSFGFDSVFDSIEIKHTARSRQGLAEGAILAIKWIVGKKGMYTFDDVLNSLS